MASVYTAFDPTKPAGTQTGPTFATSTNVNDVALWYLAVMGGNAHGFTFSTAGGTTEEPGQFIWSNGVYRVYSNNTWASGYLTTQVWTVSQDSGSTTASVCTQIHSYDPTTGMLTATTGSGGMNDVVLYVLGRQKATRVLYDAHAAATGTGAHGLGTISTQSAAAVAITGPRPPRSPPGCPQAVCARPRRWLRPVSPWPQARAASARCRE